MVLFQWFHCNLSPPSLSLLSSPLSLSDSGVGAGIDSYYEYCLKYYILLGDTEYLHRFNKVCMTTFSHGRNVCEISWIRETKTIRVFVKFGNVCKSVIQPIVSKGTCSFSSLSHRPPDLLHLAALYSHKEVHIQRSTASRCQHGRSQQDVS